MATTGLIMVTGEVRTQAYVDVPGIAREVLREIGYDRAKYRFRLRYLRCLEHHS